MLLLWMYHWNRCCAVEASESQVVVVVAIVFSVVLKGLNSCCFQCFLCLCVLAAVSPTFL